MRDTSIAAVAHSNGDRRLIFQEASGNLRQAVYSLQHNIWNTGTAEYFQLVEDARKLTPLSAMMEPSSIRSNASEVSTA